ncbi:MAG: PAS domain S-box protein [Desulfobacteraceae bacterium]|nr:PAS domain S-box protein [Desulfobacteraceae bacterium]
MALKTVRSRMQVVFVLAVTLAAASVCAGSIYVICRDGEHAILERLRVHTGFREAAIKAWARSLPAELSILANRGDLRAPMAESLGDPSPSPARSDAAVAVREQLRQFARIGGSFEELFLVNSGGWVVLSSDSGREGGYRGYQSYFKQGLKKPGVHLQTLASSSSESFNAIVAVQPVFDAAGRVSGVLAGRAATARLDEIVLDRAGLGETGETYLVGSNGVLLTESRYAGFVPGSSCLNTPQINAAIVGNHFGAGLYRGYRHVPVFGFYQWVPELEAILVTEQNREEAFSGTFAAIERLGAAAVASWFLVLIFGLPLVRWLTKSVPAAGEEVRETVAGDPARTQDSEAVEGAEAVEKSFERMTTGLQTLLEGLEERIADAGRAGEKYREIFDDALEGIFRALPDGTIVEANPAMARILGYELTGELAAGLKLQGDPGDWLELLRVLEERGEVSGFETWFYRKDGSAVWVSLNVRLNLKKDGRCIDGTAVDVAESREARQLLAAEKERLAVTLRSIGDAVISTDIEGRVVLINRAAEELTGWSREEAIGRPAEEIFCALRENTLEPCGDPVQEVLETGGLPGLEESVVLVARDGVRRIVAGGGSPVRDVDNRSMGVVLVFRDITEKRKIEEDLIRAQKLDSIGTLAGGIAHDFNNILTAILGNINLAAILGPPDSKALPRLIEAEKATLRAKGLTQQLLTFAKGGAPVRKTASIAELLKKSAEFALTGSNVMCRFNIPGDVWPVVVDAAQIGQVIHHLVMNAAEAMPGGGIVCITAENIGVDQGLPFSLKPGNYVKISVEDSGMGISEEVMHRIFDPYFTTKEKGSGMGLATSYSIVSRHDGLIEVESVFGSGTTFKVYLPAVEGVVQVERGANGGGTARKKRVLVMDDEEIVKELIGEMLAHLDYEVEFARDGAEAIDLYRSSLASGARFDAVFMDLTIPGAMGGKEAIQKLLEIDPEVRAVVSSGYANDPVMSNYRDYGFCGAITKPFSIQELSRMMGGLFNGVPC